MDSIIIFLLVCAVISIALMIYSILHFNSRLRKLEDCIAGTIAYQQYMAHCTKHTLFITKLQLMGVRDTNIAHENYEAAKKFNETINETDQLINFQIL